MAHGRPDRHGDALSWARECDGKKRYTESEAEAHARGLRSRERDTQRRERIVAYPCRWCGYFHVGHERPH
jgi:hypothetical protein